MNKENKMQSKIRLTNEQKKLINVLYVSLHKTFSKKEIKECGISENCIKSVIRKGAIERKNVEQLVSLMELSMEFIGGFYGSELTNNDITKIEHRKIIEALVADIMIFSMDLYCEVKVLDEKQRIQN